MPARKSEIDETEANAALRRAVSRRAAAERARDRAADRARAALREARREMLRASRGGKTYEEIADAIGTVRSFVSSELRLARDEEIEDGELVDA